MSSGRRSLRTLRTLALLFAAACPTAVAVAVAHADVSSSSAVPRRSDASGAGAAIELALVVNQRSGVAPLAVFFDASESRAPGVSRPFHELDYAWDFADPESGAFVPSGRSKNHAEGPLAGHVFERPGHYDVALEVRAPDGHVRRRVVPIDVLDPDRIYADATLCFSTRPEFEGCPKGARRIIAQDLGALAPHVGRGVRLLLRRGDTFTARSPLAVNVRGPSQIGAFGRGASPRILPKSAAFLLSDEVPELADWTLMDLQIDGQGNERSAGVLINGRAKNLLLLRLRAERVGDAFSAPPDIIEYYYGRGSRTQDVVDGLSIVDSVAHELVGPGVLSYIGARRLLFLGNNYADSTSGEHVLRIPYLDRGVLASNAFARAPAGRHLIKLHARNFSRPGRFAGTFTERVVIADNQLESSGGHAWSVAIGPQNAESDERVRDVIVERNRFTLGGGNARVALALFAADVTVRNNRFERGDQPICVAVARRGIEPPPRRIRVTGNTCEGTGPPELVELDGTAEEIVIRDNWVTATTKNKPEKRLTAPRRSATR